MGRHHKLTEQQIQRIEDRYIKEGKSAHNAGLPFGLCASSVLNLLVKRGAIPKTTRQNPRKPHFE